MSFANVGDAAINQDAGVQEFHLDRGLRSRGRNRRGNANGLRQRDVRKVLAFARADGQAEIAKRKRGGEFEEGLGGFRFGGAGNYEGNQEGGEQADDETNRAARKPADLRVAQAKFGEQNDHGDEKAEACGGKGVEIEGAQGITKSYRSAHEGYANGPEIPGSPAKICVWWNRGKGSGNCTADLLRPNCVHRTSRYGMTRAAPRCVKSREGAWRRSPSCRSR